MRVTWDTGPRPYSQGISQGMLYPNDEPGVAWNGLISVVETSDVAQEAKYFDGVRYLTRNVVSPFAGTLSAYTYPDELEDYIGTKDFFTAQNSRSFDLSYRTNNEIHLVYGVLLAPSQRPFSSVSDQPDPVDFQWAFTTQPQKIPGGKPSSHIVILVDDVPDLILQELEAAIYGDDEDDPQMPSVDDIVAMYEFLATMSITESTDETEFTATGPDAYVSPIVAGKFTINSPSLVNIDVTTYTVSTY